jgi:hypothetical protein
MPLSFKPDITTFLTRRRLHKMFTVEIKDENGKLVAMMTMSAKNFSTGSKGYHATGKVDVNGKKHQANFMLVEVGSKPKVAA